MVLLMDPPMASWPGSVGQESRAVKAGVLSASTAAQDSFSCRGLEKAAWN